ncbi:MAG: IS4 family transposase [Candidatus Ozemobacteraceae bacterium]
MNSGRTIFSQVMDHLPHQIFSECVTRYNGERYVKSFSCMDQFLSMAFAQLTYRESLRDIECCLRAHQTKVYHMGIRSIVSRNTLSHANECRDWRIWADFTQSLIQKARGLYAKDDFGLELDQVAYAFDSTTIDLCLELFPWAHFRKTKAAVKAHTLLDLRGNLPCWVHVTTGKVHDVNVLDLLPIETGSFYILDRGYLDYARLYRFPQQSAFFVTRIKRNTLYRRQYSRPVDKSTGLRCDQTVILTGKQAHKDYPDQLRLVHFVDPETEKRLRFITNNFAIPALTVAKLYRCRWQVELFFRWIKQHLRIKCFYGTSENAVKTQLWIAIATYLLVAIVKKHYGMTETSLYTILQIFSVSVFEKVPILQAFTPQSCTKSGDDSGKHQLTFNF